MATIVKFTKDMHPWRAGQDGVIQDDALAARLVKSGEAQDPRPYPPPDVAPVLSPRSVASPKRPMLRLRKRG